MMDKLRKAFLLLISGFVVTSLFAQREPVLKQVDVPHPYYWREMYLPQLTTGPSAVSWSPDGTSVVYSMSGTLWRQQMNETVTQQLTDGPGYDYQPDWSPDGNSIVFVRYANDAMELHILDLKSGRTTQITDGGFVNVDPRFSPDGKQIAFVTTRNSGNFRIWIGELKNNILESKPLSVLRKTATPRYYYGANDHQLSPSWSPDGKSLVFVSNPDVQHGSGYIFSVDVEGNYNPVLLRDEETNWRTDPDWSPDGNRIIYSSYLGRQWHQLWTTPAKEKGYPIQMSYGSFDVSNPRWSPNGSKIAYISNEHGNTALYIMDVASSKRQPLTITEKKFIRPTVKLTIRTVNEKGELLPSRLSVMAEGKSYAPDDAWMHGDEAFDRKLQKYETYYFHSQGEATVSVPIGSVAIKAWRGFETEIATKFIDQKESGNAVIDIIMKSIMPPPDWGTWISADVHVHMNYGGHYRNTPAHLAEQARAEDLDVVYNLVVNKEQRIPDINYFSVDADRASGSGVYILHGQEFHTSYWGHLGLLGLTENYLLPGYTMYTNTGVASGFPSNAAIADLTHQQKGLVGYVHPFDTEPDISKPLGYSLPVDVALGKVDYYEAMGYSDHHITTNVWYRLMNCGFKLTPVGGTDAMANYATLRGPVGLERVFVKLKDGDTRPLNEKFLEGIKEGRTFASNGPLIGLNINGKEPGEEIELAKKGKVNYSGFLRSLVPIEKLELVQNGKVIKSIPLTGDQKTADFSGTLQLSSSAWVLLRAYSTSTPDILDLYPYSTTNAIFINVADRQLRSASDASYFLQWIDRIEEAAEKVTTFNNAAEKTRILEDIKEARRIFEARK